MEAPVVDFMPATEAGADLTDLVALLVRGPRPPGFQISTEYVASAVALHTVGTDAAGQAWQTHTDAFIAT